MKVKICFAAKYEFVANAVYILYAYTTCNIILANICHLSTHIDKFLSVNLDSVYFGLINTLL